MIRIFTLGELQKAATERRSLVVLSKSGFGRPNPAAIVYNMQAWFVHRLINDCLYVYEPRPKRSWFKSQESMRTALRIARKASPQKWTAMPTIFLSENSQGKAAIHQLPASLPPRKYRS